MKPLGSMAAEEVEVAAAMPAGHPKVWAISRVLALAVKYCLCS